MLLKSMHKLFSGFTLAGKLTLQMGQSNLLRVLQKTYVQTNKVFKSRLSVFLLGSCCVHSSRLPEIKILLRSELSVTFASELSLTWW